MEYLGRPDFSRWFRDADLRDGVFAYIMRPAKRLRPAVLLIACGAVGGDEALALPAAASVELFHTWTLVHDDLIDNDALRRGGPTIHDWFTRRARDDGGWSQRSAEEYGRDMAVLVGDSQHAWSVWLLLETAARSPALSPTVIRLAQHLECEIINRLIEGEILDVRFSQEAVSDLPREKIVEMLYWKTGVLYEYAALAGGAIGLRETDWRHPLLVSLTRFARGCGTAFQLQDDILGIVGDRETLGKPVGSDIREGKRTTVTYYAYQAASPAERKRLDEILGNRGASDEDVAEAKRLLIELGGILKTQALARELTEIALPHLRNLPDSPHKTLLSEWARFLIERRF